MSEMRANVRIVLQTRRDRIDAGQYDAGPVIWKTDLSSGSMTEKPEMRYS